MKLTSTNKLLIKISGVAVIVTSALLFLGAAQTSSALAIPGNDTTKTYDKTGEESFTFYEKEDGEKVKFEVHFNDGEITSLYRNGKEVPENEIDDYRHLVHKRLSNLSFGPKVFAFNFDDFKWDKEKLREDMDKLREDLKDHKFEWHEFNFDEEALKENMDKLKENLKNMKKHNFHFEYDGSELKDQLEKLEKELDKLKDDSIEVEVNLDDLQDNIDELIDNLDENEIVIGNFDHQFQVFADKDGKIKHKIKIFKDKAEDGDEFVEKLKEELVNDKIISDRDDFESFELTDKNLLINGEKQSDDMYKKYKKLYKEYSDNDIEGNFKIRIQE